MHPVLYAFLHSCLVSVRTVTFEGRRPSTAKQVRRGVKESPSGLRVIEIICLCALLLLRGVHPSHTLL